MTTVAIAGGGLGALRTAEALRAAGFTDTITVFGDEPHLPYTRPPLSKEALASGVDVDALLFRRKASVDDVDWHLGSAVVGCDLGERTLTLEDGSTRRFDGLVVATGIRSRRLPIAGPSEGRFALRTAADARALRGLIRPGTRLLVLGAGFIGCEVAATATGLGAHVAVVAIDEQPMIRPLGADLGSAMRRRHETRGVRFHLGHSVDAFDGGSHVQVAVLSDGTELPVDLVIEAVGSTPNTEWLAGNGLDLTDGLLTDHALQVVSTAAPVVAVGDLARHPNALFDDIPRRIEHWNMPTETGRRAGRTLAALLAGEEPDRAPFTAMPSFWSDQYEHKLQAFGLPGLATSIECVDGDVDGACILEYHDDRGLVGVVGIDRTADLGPYRRTLQARA